MGARSRPWKSSVGLLGSGLAVLVFAACTGVLPGQRTAETRTAEDPLAVWLSNMWALRVVSLDKDTLAEDQPLTVVVATENETLETLLARCFAIRLYGVLTDAQRADFSTLRTAWLQGYGKRLDVTISRDAALRQSGLYSDLVMTGLSANSRFLELNSAFIAQLRGGPALTISTDLAKDLVKLEVLLNRVLTPDLGKQIVATEAALWISSTEEARLAIARTGSSLPESISADKRAAAFVAAARPVLLSAATDELRKSRQKVRDVFRGVLGENPDLAKTLSSAMPMVRTKK